MNSRRIIKVISFVFLCLFAVFGWFVLNNLIHESVHERDLKGLVEYGEICLLTRSSLTEFNSSTAYYIFKAKPGMNEEIQSIAKGSEYKAIIFDLAFGLLFAFICVMSILKSSEMKGGEDVNISKEKRIQKN